MGKEFDWNASSANAASSAAQGARYASEESTTALVRNEPSALAANGSPDELTLDDQLAFQAALWKLLAKRTNLYTMGESSSVPELTAHRLFEAVLFVLGIDPDDLDPHAVHRLLEDGVEETFARNLDAIATETVRAGELWEAAALSTPLLESIALRDTLESLRNFPVQYDYRSFAHEIPSDIDYPLAQPVPEALQGVAYVNEYLTRLGIENAFMQHFDLARMKALLRKVSPEYRELLINLYEPIAVNALGCILAGCDPLALSVSEADRACISEKMTGCSRAAMKTLLEAAAAELCDTLRIEDVVLRDYVRTTAVALRPRIAAFVGAPAQAAGLAGVFMAF